MTRELLSEVLDDTVKIITVESEILYNYFNDDIDIKIPDNILFYFSRNSMSYKYINIYELTHKCKEWGLKQDWTKQEILNEIDKIINTIPKEDMERIEYERAKKVTDAYEQKHSHG